MREDKNVYVKNNNGRYTPIGIQCNLDYLTDGIWYVRHNDGSRGYTSVPYITELFKVGDKEIVDVPVLCGLEDLCDKIMKSEEFNSLYKQNGYSMNDIVHVCVKKMYDFSKENKNNEHV